MKRIRYTKFTGDLSSSFGLEDLMQALVRLPAGLRLQRPLRPIPRVQQPDHGEPARGHPPGARVRRALRRRVAGKIRPALRRTGGRAHRPDHPEDAGAELHQRRAAQRRPGPAGRRQRRGPLRSHRQEHGLPRLQGPARAVRPARQIQPRPPRHAPRGRRRRDQRQLQALRVRRHPEPRHHGDALQRLRARGHRTAVEGEENAPAQHRVLGHPGAPVRLPVLMRHRGDARLLALHDPLRRRPLHARQARRHGAVAPHPHAIPGRHAEPGALPRHRRRDSVSPALRASKSARTTPTPAKACAWPSASSPSRTKT